MVYACSIFVSVPSIDIPGRLNIKRSKLSIYITVLLRGPTVNLLSHAGSNLLSTDQRKLYFTGSQFHSRSFCDSPFNFLISLWAIQAFCIDSRNKSRPTKAWRTKPYLILVRRKDEAGRRNNLHFYLQRPLYFLAMATEAIDVSNSRRITKE